MRDQVESIAVNLTYILERGVEGSHVLFRVDEIRQAFRGAASARPELATASAEAQALVRSLASLPSLGEQRSLIDTLPDAQRDLLICLYFEFLDQYVAKHGRVLQ